VTERLEESLGRILFYIASEALKARKCGEIDIAEKLSMAFKILSKEYDNIRSQEKKKGENRKKAS
jgi:hypothetical protein